jgi:glyoxylase-like metal-dependent hydrolase (beta-lactamase superfamily II)
MPSEWSEPLPIYCWAIEHDGVLRLVDTGETAAAEDVVFARMHVTREQELPAAMAAAGLKLLDVSEVVLTHAHGDHIDGLVHVRERVLNNEVELRYVAAESGHPHWPRRGRFNWPHPPSAFVCS